MKYFGTDGIRGQANVELTFDLVNKVGKGLAQVLKNKYPNENIYVAIANDTRKSRYFIKSALIANLCAYGINVIDLDIITTPAVSMLTEKNDEIKAGVMISASHNPFYDNGIKIFDANGKKLINESEEEIEKIIFDEKQFTLELAKNEEVGCVISDVEKYYTQYNEILTTSAPKFNNLKIAIDCANGSTSIWAEKVFKKLNADVTIINSNFDGININDNAGSMHPNVLSKFIQSNSGFDLGFAFDGDGDRCIAFDSNGEIIDGDVQLYLLAQKLKAEGNLINNTVVTTVMSSLGFDKSLKELDIDVVRTNVGDKYVADEMFKNNFYLGGEQSGHIIYRAFANTGDGMLSAIQLASFLENKNVKDLVEKLENYPQRLINVRVKDKHSAMKNKIWLNEIKKQEEILGDLGRILIRASGTENLVRILVEASDEQVANTICEKLRDFIMELNV